MEIDIASDLHNEHLGTADRRVSDLDLSRPTAGPMMARGPGEPTTTQHKDFHSAIELKGPGSREELGVTKQARRKHSRRGSSSVPIDILMMVLVRSPYPACRGCEGFQENRNAIRNDCIASFNIRHLTLEDTNSLKSDLLETCQT